MERKQYPWKLAKLQHVFVRHGICADQEITATESSGKSFIYRTFDVTLSIENNHQQTHLVQFPNLHDGHYQHSALSSCHICKRVETCMKVTTTTWCFFADGEDPIVHLVPNFCLHCIPEKFCHPPRLGWNSQLFHFHGSFNLLIPPAPAVLP